VSHSTVLVVLPPSEASLDDRLSAALAPFSENIEDNPQGKWDWWELGGRWPNSLNLEPGMTGTNGELSWVFTDGYTSPERHAEALPREGAADSALAAHVDWSDTDPTFALLDAEGKWHERGEMGWWGVVHDETSPDEWELQWRSLVALIPPDATVAVVDVHI